MDKESLPTSPVEYFEELVENKSLAPQIIYNALTGERIEIPPGESKIVVRSRKIRKKWYGRRQETLREDM